MNWKQEFKKQLINIATTKLVETVFNKIPSSITLDFKPMKDYVTGQGPKPRPNQILYSSPSEPRKQVIVFEDNRYNYNQY